MNETPAGRASSAAAASLIAALCCLGLMVFHATNHEDVEPLVMIFSAIGLGSAIVLHLVFVGLYAQRSGRSPGRLVALALLTFPIGSIVALVFQEWRDSVDTVPGRTGGA